MTTNRDVGEALRRSRLAAGLSLGALAARTHYDKGYLSKVERGLRKPSAEFIRHCDAVLEAEGELTRMAVPPSPPAFVKADSFTPPASVKEAIGWQEWWSRAWTERTEPDAFEDAYKDEAGSAYLALFASLRQIGQCDRPDRALRGILALIDVLRDAFLSSQDGWRERLLAAYCCELAGWMYQERGRFNEADSWTRAAAALARGTELAAYARVRQAEIAVHHGEVDSALKWVESIDEVPEVSARVRGFAAHRRAQAYAVAGETSGCLKALSQAEDWLNRAEATTGYPLTLGSSTIVDPCGLTTGWCHLVLGNHDAALDSLERESAALPQTSRRVRAVYGACLGTAYVATGQVDAACVVGREALTELQQTRSHAAYVQLRSLAKYLLRLRQHVEAQDLYVDMTAALYGLIDSDR